jgi:hypothetical protein
MYDLYPGLAPLLMDEKMVLVARRAMEAEPFEQR